MIDKCQRKVTEEFQHYRHHLAIRLFITYLDRSVFGILLCGKCQWHTSAVVIHARVSVRKMWCRTFDQQHFHLTDLYALVFFLRCLTDFPVKGSVSVCCTCVINKIHNKYTVYTRQFNSTKVC